MSTPVLIIGESGSGKSRSVVTLNPQETFVIASLAKDMPFRGWRKKYTTLSKDGGNYFVTDNYEAIEKTLKYVDEKRPEVKTIVIDDFQYLMANEFMRRSGERGYDKFTEIGEHAWRLVFNARLLRQDLIVIFLSHSDTDDKGKTKVKTIGKLLDDKITVEGMFSIVLNTFVEDGKYYFETQTNGSNTTKSPEEMFSERRIPNDLNLVVQSIHKYNTEG